MDRLRTDLVTGHSSLKEAVDALDRCDLSRHALWLPVYQHRYPGLSYREYLALHQNKTCRRLHLLGMAVALVIFVAALFTSYWMWSVFAPVLVYPFAWTGHLVFEKNTPATWSNPGYSVLADLRMTWDIIRGRIAL